MTCYSVEMVNAGNQSLLTEYTKHLYLVLKGLEARVERYERHEARQSKQRRGRVSRAGSLMRGGGYGVGKC